MQQEHGGHGLLEEVENGLVARKATVHEGLDEPSFRCLAWQLELKAHGTLHAGARGRHEQTGRTGRDETHPTEFGMGDHLDNLYLFTGFVSWLTLRPRRYVLGDGCGPTPSSVTDPLAVFLGSSSAT
jgi:hypothetical protein